MCIRDRYRGRALDWKRGGSCLHMARFHLRQMGHKPEPIPAIYSEIGAARALRERGWTSVAEVLDAQAGLCRIAPLEMLPGDLAVVASGDGIGAIFLCLTRHKFAGWREDIPEMVTLDLEFSEISGAWRV